MLNHKQQIELNEFRNSAIDLAAETFPDIPDVVRRDCIAIGFATLSAFFQENPVASPESVAEYILGR